MLEFLLQAVDDVTMDQKTAITEAINIVVERRITGEKVGFKHVLELLKENEKNEIASVGSLSHFYCYQFYLGACFFIRRHSWTEL